VAGISSAELMSNANSTLVVQPSGKERPDGTLPKVEVVGGRVVGAVLAGRSTLGRYSAGTTGATIPPSSASPRRRTPRHYHDPPGLVARRTTRTDGWNQSSGSATGGSPTGLDPGLPRLPKPFTGRNTRKAGTWWEGRSAQFIPCVTYRQSWIEPLIFLDRDSVLRRNRMPRSTARRSRFLPPSGRRCGAFPTPSYPKGVTTTSR
jgi:hypothetical protein